MTLVDKMRNNPSLHKKPGQSGLVIKIKKGPEDQLKGLKITFKTGQLTRICCEGPGGRSLLLETLLAMTEAESKSMLSVCWPQMSINLEKKIELYGSALCYFAPQNRFFIEEKRTLNQLFQLESMVMEYMKNQEQSRGCPVCRGKLKILELNEFAKRYLELSQASLAIYISAPVIHLKKRQLQELLTSGFTRFWIQEKLVDSDNIKESGLWNRVDAVVIDIIRPHANAVDRIIEALMLVRELGHETVLIKSDFLDLALKLDGLICLDCLTSQVNDDDALNNAICPDMKQLLTWYEETVVSDVKGDSIKMNLLFSFLDIFSLSDLPLSTSLDKLGWIKQGLILMIEKMMQGGPGRFVIIDSPFWGMNVNQITTVKELIVKTRSEGWGWIVAGDENHLLDIQDQLIDLKANCVKMSDDCNRNFTQHNHETETWNPWKGELLFMDDIKIKVEGGQWRSVPTTEKLEKSWTTQDWKLIPEDKSDRNHVVLAVASRHQAVRLSKSHRRTLAGFLGWERLLAERMALLPDSRTRGVTTQKLLGRRKLDLCLVCRGLGVIEDLEMGRMVSICPSCSGVGVRFDASAPRYHHLTLYDIMLLTVKEFAEQITFSSRIVFSARNALRMGFGGMSVSRRLWTLSTSEAWLSLILSQLLQLRHGGVWIVEQPFLALSAEQKDALKAILSDFVAKGGFLLTIDPENNVDMRTEHEI